MHDTVVPHLGVQWRALARRTWEGFVRGGYEYAKSPIGPQTGSTNYVDRDRHSIFRGAGAAPHRAGEGAPGDVRFDLHFQWSLLVEDTTLKSNPADTVGDYTAGGHIFNLGRPSRSGSEMKGQTLLSLCLVVAACATIGSPSNTEDAPLPSSGVGPFRKLGNAEAHGIAPFVLDGSFTSYTEPTVFPASTDATSAAVVMYAVQTTTNAQGAPQVAIVRSRADDARSFYGSSADLGGKPKPVMVADQPWEGGVIGGPSALAVGTSIFLYYSAAGGIGLARSSDGFTFVKEPAPVLAPDPAVAWETTTPSAPSVAIYPNGRFRMLYAAGGSIGEADSADGISWARLDADPSTPAIDPVLTPAPPPDAGAPDSGLLGPFDTAQVTDPCLLPRTTPAGRLQVRVLYTGYTAPASMAGRNGTIGFAARYGDSGPLVRQPTPVYSVSLHEAAPALFEWSGGSMLYVHQDETATTTVYPSIAAAYAPANLTLPAPGPYPSSP